MSGKDPCKGRTQALSPQLHVGVPEERVHDHQRLHRALLDGLCDLPQLTSRLSLVGQPRIDAPALARSTHDQASAKGRAKLSYKAYQLISLFNV